jgi:amicyanin
MKVNRTAIVWIFVLLICVLIYSFIALSRTPVHHSVSMSHPTSQSSDTAVDLSAEKNVVVTMNNMQYTPGIIKIKKGTTVTWVNEDQMEHNAMKDHNEEDAHEHSPEYDDETGGFNSPMLKTGESWSFTFNEVGTYGYHCAPHPQMRGTVEVVD